MNNNHVFYSKNIFLVYCGLHAAGYDLCPGEFAPAIKEFISLLKQNQKIINYFKQARLDSCPVNPYWPRGFLLTLASFYDTSPDQYSVEERMQLTMHLNTLDHVNEHERNDDTKRWLYELSLILSGMSQLPEFAATWSTYCTSLADKESFYNDQISQALQIFVDKMSMNIQELPQIKFVPNYLQAPQITDPVFIQNTIYVICHKPDTASILHELLHYSMAQHLDDNNKLIAQRYDLLQPILSAMKTYGYAWDNSVGSWINVFNEHFMRAASLWLSYDKDKAIEIARSYSDDGFRYVPGILDCFYKEWMGIGSLETFLEKCLDEYMKI